MTCETGATKMTYTATNSFKLADRHIEKLLDIFVRQRACPCCVARALLCHGARLYMRTRGSAETVEELEAFAELTRRHPLPAPDDDAQLH
jgi:hypothetical protein